MLTSGDSFSPYGRLLQVLEYCTYTTRPGYVSVQRKHKGARVKKTRTEKGKTC